MREVVNKAGSKESSHVQIHTHVQSVLIGLVKAQPKRITIHEHSAECIGSRDWDLALQISPEGHGFRVQASMVLGRQ